MHSTRMRAIPASPIFDGTDVLFDYNAYWVEDLYNYVLYTGDMSLATQVWPNLVRLMNGWYPAQAQAGGLLANDLGPADYAYIARQGQLVAYYNAGYVRALKQAARIATWAGQAGRASAWNARATSLAGVFNSTFWDAGAGAYRDTPNGTVVHPEDGTSFAILAGLASPAQTKAALNYLAEHDARSYGNTIADNDTWDSPAWGQLAGQRVYPFISYFEVLARYQAGLGSSALDLIRREWGYMVNHGPHQGMWEDIGPYGGPPTDQWPSWDSGWSSGAAPALTNYVLGVQPTSPGFATFTVTPHPSNVVSARGSVPTPQGDISVSWKVTKGKLALTVTAPAGERWTNAPVKPAAGNKKAGALERGDLARQ